MKRICIAAWLGMTALLTASPQTQGAEDVIYYRPAENAFVVDWLISSQHRFPFAYLGAALNYDALTATGGEKDCAPEPGVQAGGGTNWEERHFKSGTNAPGICEFRPCIYSFTYAFVYLYCDQPYADVQLLTGSDDGLLAILNGQVVQRVQMERGPAVDQDRAVVTLRKGWNRLLCKIDDYGGGHGLVLRFKKADGELLTDYKVCFTRPAEGVEVRFVDGAAYESEAAQLLKDAAKINAETGDLQAATGKCGEVIGKYPKAQAAAQAMYLAGTFQVSGGRLDEAVKTFAKVLRRYPYSKWVEDALLAQAAVQAARHESATAEATLAELIAKHGKSSLVSEAMLRLAALQAGRRDLQAADATLSSLRQKFPNTVEAVKALDGLADNQQARGNRDQAAILYRQVIDESQKLSEGKYVFYVNVQAVLKGIAESARAKLDGGK